MMHMTFYWSKEVTLLFTWWKTHTWLEYSITLIICLVVSLFFQYLESRRLKLRLLSASRSVKATAAEEAPLLPNWRVGMKSWWGKIQSAALFGTSSALGYMLMLAVMSFNGGVLLAVILGLTIGYAAFQSDEGMLAVAQGDNPCACA